MIGFFDAQLLALGVWFLYMGVTVVDHVCVNTLPPCLFPVTDKLQKNDLFVSAYPNWEVGSPILHTQSYHIEKFTNQKKKETAQGQKKQIKINLKNIRNQIKINSSKKSKKKT